MLAERGATVVVHDAGVTLDGTGFDPHVADALFRGFENLTDSGQIDRCQKVVKGVVSIMALAQEELLAALCNLQPHTRTDQPRCTRVLEAQSDDTGGASRPDDH